MSFNTHLRDCNVLADLGRFPRRSLEDGGARVGGRKVLAEWNAPYEPKHHRFKSEWVRNCLNVIFLIYVCFILKTNTLQIYHNHASHNLLSRSVCCTCLSQNLNLLYLSVLLLAWILQTGNDERLSIEKLHSKSFSCMSQVRIKALQSSPKSKVTSLK